MGRIRGVLKWDAMQDFGWAITDDDHVYYVRRNNFRHLPTVQLRHGLEVEFSDPAINVDFLNASSKGKQGTVFLEVIEIRGPRGMRGLMVILEKTHWRPTS
jgi:hypothetical protein